VAHGKISRNGVQKNPMTDEQASPLNCIWARSI
jgi:hypothetical protein